MKELNIKQIQLVSGANYGLLLDASLTSVGAYLGASVAYLEPLMTYTGTLGPAGLVQTYTPDTMILISGVILGASIGYALSKRLQTFYNSLETQE